MLDFICTMFIPATDEIFTYYKTLKQKRFFYENILREIHEMQKITKDFLGIEDMNSNEIKNETDAQDKLMYKLYNCKALNKTQKILYKMTNNNAPNSINETSLNQMGNLNANFSPKNLDFSPSRWWTSHNKERNWSGIRPKSAMPSKTKMESLNSNENKTGKSNEKEEKKRKTSHKNSLSTNDPSFSQNQEKIYSMNENFWNKVLTTDLRDSSEISEFFFDSKNMVSLKNFMMIAQKNQPKNPKIYFNHKIYKEMEEDYKPKILTSRECEFFEI